MKKLLRTFFLPVLLIGNLSAQDLDSLKQKAESGEITADAADYFLNRSKEIFDNHQINQAITEDLQMLDRARINEDLTKYYPQNTYLKINKAPEQVEVNGNWTGKAFVYDWGGNKIREELDLSLSLTQTGSSVTGVVTIMY